MPDIANLIDLVAGFYDRYGYLLVFFGALGENTALLGFFLPGNTLALLGAFYARQGTLNIGWVILLASLGTLLGYHVDYLIGRFVLAGAAGSWSTSRLGRRLRLAGRLRLARRFLSRHGGKAILISHIIGQFRSVIALSAGMTRMRYRRFLVFELVAACLWNTAFCLVGYLIGIERERLELLFERSGWVVLGVLVALFLVWRLARPRMRRRVHRPAARALLPTPTEGPVPDDGCRLIQPLRSSAKK